jgi:hypothetical protein
LQSFALVVVVIVATAQLPMYVRAIPTLPTPMATQASPATFPFVLRPARIVAFAPHMDAPISASATCSTGLAQLAHSVTAERIVHFTEPVSKECLCESNAFYDSNLQMHLWFWLVWGAL